MGPGIIYGVILNTPTPLILNTLRVPTVRTTNTMSAIECIYAPQCLATFKTKRNMERHCRNTHGGLDRPYCTECDQLKFFASKTSLRNHMKVHQQDVECPHCAKLFKSSSAKKHIKNCPERHGQAPRETRDEVDDDLGDIEPLYRAPPTGLTRSAHSAPKKLNLEDMLKDFVKWIESPTALAKSGNIKSPDVYLNKFRTVLGRLASFHHVSAEDLLKRLRRGNGWSQFFSKTSLNDFTMSLATTDGGRGLCKSTIYNYVRALVVFFDWNVEIKERVDMDPARKLLDMLAKSISRQRSEDNNREAKAARFESMPSFSDMLEFLSTELKDKAVAAYQDFKATRDATWEQYVACRNYILVAMLIGIPPQRATVFDTVSVHTLREQDGHAILMVDKHKTSHVYGPVVIAIPPTYKVQFDQYLEIRSELSVLADTGALFINKSGRPEEYLTKRFQAIMSAKFNCNITIRDCRSLYITYASKHLSHTELYKLASLMFHSFKTQQTVYRGDRAVDRAISNLQSTTRELPALAGMYAIMEDEFDDLPSDELFLELAEQSGF